MQANFTGNVKVKFHKQATTDYSRTDFEATAAQIDRSSSTQKKQISTFLN